MITLEEDEETERPLTFPDDSLKPTFNMGKRLSQSRAPNKIRNDSIDINLKKSFAEDPREASGSLNDSEAEI